MEDLKLTELKAVKTIPGTSLHRVLLGLNETPTARWRMVFEANWKSNNYSMKAKAEIKGAGISMDVLVTDLEGEHIPQLKKIIEETNKQIVAENAISRANELAKIAAANAVEAADANKLEELRQKLKF